ncbi:hypothetical protein [Nonomuraea basaltis]|uniref:hypothetical protein n=1 Tax=Nonomuraea basaltis TaxID=2495887 RepID=UPI001981D326|nr:hypothetical protein [Nonomuraea basaltis]
MFTGVLAILLGEPLATRAPVLLTWFALVAVPGLELSQIAQTAPSALRIWLHPASGAGPHALWRQVETCMRDLLARQGLGQFTLTWDHLLGTFSYDPTRRFSSDQLGMAAKPNYPTAYLAQLAEPFRASGACHAEPAPPEPTAQEQTAT